MKNNEVTVRPFCAATDTETLADIWYDASLLAHPFIGEVRLREQRQLVIDQYLPNAETWVACHQGEVIGFVSLLGNFIGAIFVAPGWQGLGAGRKLIAHALDLKRELLLEVYTENRQAVRFYASLGFQEISRRDVDDFGYPYANARLHLTA